MATGVWETSGLVGGGRLRRGGVAVDTWFFRLEFESLFISHFELWREHGLHVGRVVLAWVFGPPREVALCSSLSAW